MKSHVKTLAVAMGALMAALSLSAQVFKDYYSTYPLTEEEFSKQDVERITDMLVGPGVALYPGAEMISGSASYQVGVFSNLVAQAIPSFTNGVIISTGDIGSGASLTNVYANMTWPSEGIHDRHDPCMDDDFNTYFGADLARQDKSFYDQTGLVLYIQPKNTTINIPFIMASEEFYRQSDEEEYLPRYPDCPSLLEYEMYSDKFVFFLQEIGSAAKCVSNGRLVDDALTYANEMHMTNNIARLPEGGDVEIASVNQYTNIEYFISNVVTNEDEELVFPAGNLELPMEFNGAIVGPVAVAEKLDTSKVYKLKIMLADYKDAFCNSVVFLRERGLTSGADLKIDVTGPAEALPEPGEVTFVNTVSNIGPAIADDVVVTNSLPEGATFLDCDCDPSALSFVTNNLGVTNGLVWAIGNRFRPNSNAVMRVRCYLPDVAKTYKDSALVVTSTGDYDENNNRAEADADVGGEVQEITVRAISTNKVYGAEISLSDLQFVLSVEGTNGTEVISGIDVAFTNQLGVAACPTNIDAAVGTYGIVLSNLVDNAGRPLSARTTYVDGVLTVTQRVLTIIADDTNKVYGTTVEFAGTEFTTDPKVLPNGETVTNVTLTSIAATNKFAIVDEYVGDIVPSHVVSGCNFDTNNYFIVFSNGTFTVKKAKLTIRRKRDIPKFYGDEVDLDWDKEDFAFEGLIEGDSVANVVQTSVGASPTASCEQDYDIELSDATGVGLGNYEIFYQSRKIKVDRLFITITANDTNMVYGTPLNYPRMAKADEFSVSDPVTRAGASKPWPNSEKVTEVWFTGVYATNAATTVGLYEEDIEPSHVVKGEGASFSTNNYVITFVKGDLTVTNAPLTIIANDTNKVYGAEFSFTGDEYTTDPEALYNDDAITSLTLTSDGTNRLVTCGEYEIVVTNALGIGLENYDITYSNGTLTVTNAHLTIIANSTNRMYGTAIERFDGTEFTTIPKAGELPNGESVTKVTISCTWATNKFAVVKDYPGDIVPSHEVEGIDTNNYAITFEPGTLTVTNAPLTITANSTNRVYGRTYTFTGNEYSVAGLLNGDTITNVTLTCDATNSTAECKAHVISVGGATGKGDGNYSITYVSGTFTVDPLKIWITANDTNKVYGSAVEFAGTEFTLNTADGSPLPNGEKVETVMITSVPATNLAAEVGEYVKAIVPSHDVTGSANFKTNNYDIVFSNGTLTVTQALLTVRAADATWHVRKPRPSYGFENFSSQLAPGDTEADVTGGSGSGLDLEYTNRVWAAKEPDKGNEGVYSNEIWIVLSSFDGPRATNYVIKVEPGDLTVDAALPELKASLAWELNGKGLFEGTLTVVNTGDGEADADSDYWVELIPGPATNGTKVSVPHAYYLASRTGTIPGGPDRPDYQETDYVYEYQDLTEQVKAELLANYGHTEFGTNESVTVTGISVYHWKRYNPSKGYFNTNAFFVVGHLYNPADKAPTDFRVSDDEKKAAAPLLDAGVSDYLEMTRLNLLPYYHWNTSDQTWK